MNKFVPPLIISKEDLESAAEILNECLLVLDETVKRISSNIDGVA